MCIRDRYKGKLIAPDSDEFVSDHNLFNYQAKIIRELADKESCVIIGRAADYVLKDYDNVVSVFVHASKDYCVRQAIERSAYTGKDVEKFVERTDKYRSDFYRYYTGQEWTDARNYDLCLNSERLGFEGTMEAIEEYIKAVSYTHLYGGTPIQFAADAYDGMYAIKAAVEKSGVTPDMSVSDICDAMETAMTEITVDGLTSKGMTWNADGEPNKEPKAVKIENGSYVSMDK